MVSAFCNLVTLGEAPLTEEACQEWLGHAFEPFRATALLVSAEPADAVLCPACFEQHWLPVERDPEDGSLFVICPLGGRCPVSDAELSRLAVDRAQCLGLLQAALGKKQRAARELVPSRAWYLGSAHTGDIDWNALFVAGSLTGAELARLADAVALLPRYMLDVVLTGDDTDWPEIALARPLHNLALAEVAEWSAGTIRLCEGPLERWLQSFLGGRKMPPVRGGRPPNKADWVRANWARHRDDLAGLPSDKARAQLLSSAYARAVPGGKLGRTVVVGVLNEVMPDRARNCR